MPAYKDNERNTWMIKFQYKNWMGERKWVTKRDFKTKRDALQWEREFLLQKKGSLEMNFANFANLYREDVPPD